MVNILTAQPIQQLRKTSINNTSYTNISEIISSIFFLENFLLAAEISLPHSFTVSEVLFPDPHLFVFLGLLSAASWQRIQGRQMFRVLACSQMSSLSHLIVSLWLESNPRLEIIFSSELEGIILVVPTFLGSVSHFLPVYCICPLFLQ